MERNTGQTEKERRNTQTKNPRETNREILENRNIEETQKKLVVNTEENQRPVKGKLKKTVQLREATKANGQTEERKINYRNTGVRELNKPDRGKSDNKSIGRIHELNKDGQKTEQKPQNKYEDDLNKQSNANGQRKGSYSNANKSKKENKVVNKKADTQQKSETNKQKISSKLSGKANSSQKPKDSKVCSQNVQIPKFLMINSNSPVSKIKQKTTQYLHVKIVKQEIVKCLTKH